VRDVTRYRTELVRARAQEANRLQTGLESANLTLGGVASDVLGTSGRAMVAALVAGEQDPAALADLARGRLRAKLPEVRLAREGRWQPHQPVLRRQMLAHSTVLQTALAQVQQEERAAVRTPVDAAVARSGRPSQAVANAWPPPSSPRSAPQVSRFPSAKHLASWAGVCPGTRTSAGKRLRGRTPHGHVWLRSALGEAAWAATHGSPTHHALAAHSHRRLARRRGKTNALLAVAHSRLVICWHVLHSHQPSCDLGADYCERLDAHRLEQRSVH
jgi:transposase